MAGGRDTCLSFQGRSDCRRYTSLPMKEDKQQQSPQRVLIGHFSVDTDVDDIVDAILATVPADDRPPEDRPNRMPDK
jgi:hypothetical protein